MNSGECCCAPTAGQSRFLIGIHETSGPARFARLAGRTQLIDSLSEISIYWNMVEGGIGDTPASFVRVLDELGCATAPSTSKTRVESVEKAGLLTEILGIVFGNRQNVRATRPFSYVLCPMSPLVIDRAYTDAYLATVGWDLRWRSCPCR